MGAREDKSLPRSHCSTGAYENKITSIQYCLYNTHAGRRPFISGTQFKFIHDFENLDKQLLRYFFTNDKLCSISGLKDSATPANFFFFFFFLRKLFLSLLERLIKHMKLQNKESILVTRFLAKNHILGEMPKK